MVTVSFQVNTLAELKTDFNTFLGIQDDAEGAKNKGRGKGKGATAPADEDLEEASADDDEFETAAEEGVTLESLRELMAEKMKNPKNKIAIKALLAKAKATSLANLKEEHYEKFSEKLAAI